MKEIQLVLTVDEVNIIFNALSNRPFKEVFELIGKINEQAAPQLKDELPEEEA
jgi:hypothetical protein